MSPEQFILDHKPVIAVSFAILLCLGSLFGTLYAGYMTTLTVFYRSKHRASARLFVASIAIVGLVVRMVRPDDHSPLTTLTKIHLFVFVFPCIALVALMVTKVLSPGRVGRWHYACGILCAVLFTGILVTGYMIYAAKN